MTVPKFSVSQITSMTWPFERDVAAISQAGVPAIGISLGKLRTVGIDAAERMCREAGLEVSALTTAGNFSYVDAALQRQQVEEVKRLIADVSRLSPGCLMISSGNDPTLCWEEADPKFRRILDELLPVAQAKNVGVMVRTPLARGLLTGKFAPGQPLSSRIGRPTKP